uniref:Acetyl-coenzyme A synthetase n=1 Tax=Chlamydomonas leiostraca TaxID=1034604 RepID=A0A7S0RB14_9CHLO|mmetsp:Transcript_18307/g.46220  ORF Transcript_18307/g.46220 Transcript_18307/m.46220 type:complete len:674 (+) Transcript_18307:114-2135(+)
MNRLDVLSRQLTAGLAVEAPSSGTGKDRKSWIASKADYERLYKWSVEDPQGFWAQHANDFYWQQKWVDSHMSYNLDVSKGPVKVEWFKGGKTNLSFNCLDRWVASGRGSAPCFLWEGNEPGQQRSMTYEQVMSETCRVANWLKLQGVKKGDAVTIYMSMVPELPIAMLACVRIGAVHSVVFGGFSADSLASRIVDCKGDVVITCSGAARGNKKALGLKAIVDSACQQASKGGHTVKRVLVLEDPCLPRKDTPWVPGRDVWWADEVPRSSHYCAPEWLDSEDRSFLLYTSGSTGKPKGVVHTTGGYMVGTAVTSRYYFDLQPGDIYFSTADCGWITGHSYLTYGPLLNGVTCVLFGGVPNYPDASRLWQLCDKYKPRVLYTAPTLLRGLLQQGDKWLKGYDLSSLQVLGSVGEPIGEQAWHWFRDNVGKGRVPTVVDTWWQTETGMHMISPFPGGWCAPKASCAQLPFFGVQPVVLTPEGTEMTGPGEGILCMKAPWPAMARTLHGDHDRFEATYFAAFKGYYFTGDGCRRDEDGHLWITGRVDDVINVSGHRIGTAEVESALTEHEMCAEAAVIGVDHAVKGQSIYAYVTLKENAKQDEAMRNVLRDHVRAVIGPFAVPDVIHWAPGLPKTRSGKIMRRVLRKIAMKQEHELGDISTLAEPTVVSTLINLRGV